jgi:hypothetical protein
MAAMHVGLVIALAAMAAEPDVLDATPAAPSELRFSVAAKKVRDGKVLLQATVKNIGSKTVKVAYGMCFSNNVLVRLYRTPDRKPPAVWDSEARWAPCRLARLVGPIGPKRSISPRELAGEVDARGVPDDGTYYATATIRLDEPKMESPELPAGTLVVHRR